MGNDRFIMSSTAAAVRGALQQKAKLASDVETITPITKKHRRLMGLLLLVGWGLVKFFDHPSLLFASDATTSTAATNNTTTNASTNTTTHSTLIHITTTNSIRNGHLSKNNSSSDSKQHQHQKPQNNNKNNTSRSPAAQMQMLPSKPHNDNSSTSNHDEPVLSPLCTMEQLVAPGGAWVSHTHDRPPYSPKRGEVQQKTCTHFDANQPWKTWDWVPKDDAICHYPPFDAHEYCSLAHNQTVLIIGDSINFDIFLHLSHMLGVPQALPKARRRDAQLISHVCNRTSRLIGQRDFTLTGSLKNYVETNDATLFPNIVLLNRGAHYVEDHILQQDFHTIIFPLLHQWQHSCLLLWRTSIQGHVDCHNYTQPATSFKEVEHDLAYHAPAGYGWQHFEHQNQLVRKGGNQTNLQSQVMNAYPTNILRWDAHVHNPARGDCLHTCLPSDDGYDRLLLHMMRLHRQEKAV